MRYAFISPQWFAALHATICEKIRTAAQPDLRYALCEVFTGVPANYATIPGNKTAWHARIRGTEVEFELKEVDDVDFKAFADYHTVLPLARYDTMNRADREAELQTMVQAAIASGKLRLIGSTPGTSGPLQSLHDAIARLTS